MKRKLSIILGSLLIVSYFLITYYLWASNGIKVPLNGILFWTGAHASIPANYSRDTDYDNKFIQGGSAGFTTSANGGSATPNHTANAHGLNGGTHLHSVTGLGASTNVTNLDEVMFSGIFIAAPEFGAHSHSLNNSNSTAITYQNATPTIVEADTEPQHITVIAIKPDDTNQDIPDDAVVFTNNTDLPTGYEKYAAANNKFFKGADTGADGGDTTNISTHTHISTHPHDIDDHNHALKVSGPSSPTTEGSTNPPTTSVRVPAHHNVTLTNKSLSDLSEDDGNIASVNGEPAYVELLGIQNTSGSSITSLDVIIGYVGTEASIPTGWELVSATIDKQIRSTTTDGDIENTGGSDQHGHGTSSAHSHSHNGTHIHNTFVRLTGILLAHNTPADVTGIPSTDRHGHGWNIGATQPTGLSNTTFTMSTDDGRFPYRTMIFIKRVPYASIHLKGNTILKGNILLGGLMIGFGMRRRHERKTA